MHVLQELVYNYTCTYYFGIKGTIRLQGKQTIKMPFFNYHLVWHMLRLRLHSLQGYSKRCNKQTSWQKQDHSKSCLICQVLSIEEITANDKVQVSELWERKIQADKNSPNTVSVVCFLSVDDIRWCCTMTIIIRHKHFMLDIRRKETIPK